MLFDKTAVFHVTDLDGNSRCGHTMDALHRSFMLKIVIQGTKFKLKTDQIWYIFFSLIMLLLLQMIPL